MSREETSSQGAKCSMSATNKRKISTSKEKASATNYNLSCMQAGKQSPTQQLQWLSLHDKSSEIDTRQTCQDIKRNDEFRRENPANDSLKRGKTMKQCRSQKLMSACEDANNEKRKEQERKEKRE